MGLNIFFILYHVIKKRNPISRYINDKKNRESGSQMGPFFRSPVEWGHVDDLTVFIQKCEVLDTNLVKAINKIDDIFKSKHSTIEDVEYLKKLEIDFRIFSFIPLGRKINKKEFDSYFYNANFNVSFSIKMLMLLARLTIKRGRNKDNVDYYPDEEVELNEEKFLLYRNLITKYLDKSITASCVFFDNKETYKWDDKKEEFRSIIILNVDGYKFLNEFFEKLYIFFICLPFHILDDYTPQSIGFGFIERRSIAENEPDLLKRKEIYAEGMAQLEMSILGTGGRYYAQNMYEYPEGIVKYKKAIEVLEERIKHSTPTEVSIIEKSQVHNEKISVASIDDFLTNKTNNKLLQQIMFAFNKFEGKRLAILIYLLQEVNKIISINSNSKTQSRKHFIQLFKGDTTFDKFQAVNKYIDPFTNELNLPTLKENDTDYINIKEKLTKILENPVV